MRMTDREIKSRLEIMKKWIRETKKSDDGEARAFLMKTGIYTEKGNLRKPYR